VTRSTVSALCETKEDDRKSEDEDRKLDALERRQEEDELVNQHYADIPFPELVNQHYVDIPFPERQLLSLAHSMIRHGLIDEDDLAKHMKVVEKRLNASIWFDGEFTIRQQR